jgi:hypothetical protein
LSNEKPVKIELKPNTSRYRKVPLERYTSKYSGNIIQQRKECLSCSCLHNAKVVPNVQQTLFSHTEAVSEDKNKVLGICTWSVYWKVLYKTEKPKKCSKIKKVEN